MGALLEWYSVLAAPALYGTALLVKWKVLAGTSWRGALLDQRYYGHEPSGRPCLKRRAMRLLWLL